MGRNRAQAQQPNIIPLQHTKGRQVLGYAAPEGQPVQAGERPRCANPTCDNFVILTPTGRISKYCANPQCPKTAWYYSKISKEVRAKNAEVIAQEQQKRVFAEGYAQALADQSQAVKPPDSAPMVAVFERIAAAIESGALTQMRLPLSNNGQPPNKDVPPKPTSPEPEQADKKKANLKSDAAIQDLLEVQSTSAKTTEGLPAGKKANMQIALLSNIKNIENPNVFPDEDLPKCLNHPEAFNRHMIEKEIKRRAKLAKTVDTTEAHSSTPLPAQTSPAPGNSRQLKGAEIQFAAPDFEELDLI